MVSYSSTKLTGFRAPRWAVAALDVNLRLLIHVDGELMLSSYGDTQIPEKNYGHMKN